MKKIENLKAYKFGKKQQKLLLTSLWNLKKGN